MLCFVLIGLIHVQQNEITRLAHLCARGTWALATLLWSGHAGATEGALGTVHRIGHIAHMVATAIWIGGIAAFALLLCPRLDTRGNNIIIVAALLQVFRAS